MDELHVPKRRIAAQALLEGGPPRQITLFLAEGAPGHAGPERPSDVLNGGHDFIPAFDDDAGAMTFLNRGAVEAIRVPGAAVEGEPDALALVTEHELELTLRGGASLRGLVSYQRPPGRARLGDFLNEPEPFFRLLEESGVVLVNKRHVVRILLRQS